jgi:hypothetical protein
MVMNTPVPYGRSTLSNSPLLANGADFPCKLRPGVYDAEGASNVYALGSTQPLRFTGQAVHGGGSCQISITYDRQPTKDSVWKVIKSIEGGCPAQGWDGNMGGDAGAADPFEYQFTIPSDIPTGNGTIAWTWFNKVGEREMYMNCGPISLTGTSGSQANFHSYPDMFKANINNGCIVPENKDVVFPDPGIDITRMNGETDAFAIPTGISCVAADNSRQIRPTSTLPGSRAQSNQFSTARKTHMATNRPSFTTSTHRPDATESGFNSSALGAISPGTLCTSEGMWNCVSGNSFQRCAGGLWSVVQRLAMGTSCAQGKSAELRIDDYL